MTAAERQWVVEGTAELNQLTYFRDSLASKWKSDNVLHWGKGYNFVYIGKEKVMVLFKISKDHISLEETP